MRAIGLDILLDQPTEAAKDAELRTQTKYVTDKIRTRNSDRVIRPFDRDVPDERDRRI